MVEAKELREWQKLALSLWVENSFRGIVEVATAGGKTFFAIQGITEWLKKTKQGKVLVISWGQMLTQAALGVIGFSAEFMM